MHEEIRVLMIDDDEDTWALTNRHLVESPITKYTLDWEADAERAVTRMCENRHDIYLVDYRLQGRNGIEVFLQARASGCRGAVIILTAFGNPDLDHAAMAAGVDDYLHKESLLNGQLERAIRYAVERKRSEQAVMARQLALSHMFKMSTLGKMSTCIAHEIKNPLTILTWRISGMQRRLQAHELTPELAERSLVELGEAVRRITRITNSLYEYARDGSNDPYEPTEVWNLIQSACDLSLARLRVADVELRVNEVPRNLVVPCRAVEISQVLVNLISNAADAVQDLEERWIQVEVNEAGDRIQFAVTDSGSGISESTHAKIMQPFFTTKAPGKGLGLGLAICRGIAEQHKGELRIDRNSKHTRFVVDLPKDRSNSGQDRPMRVLVVDDEEDMVLLMLDELRKGGCEVFAARNGGEALEVLRKEDVDLVFTDVRMPGVDGLSLFRQTRNEKPSVRFVLMTGHPSAQLIREMQEKEVAVLAKPFDMEDIQRVVGSFSRSPRGSKSHRD